MIAYTSAFKVGSRCLLFSMAVGKQNVSVAMAAEVLLAGWNHVQNMIQKTLQMTRKRNSRPHSDGD